MYYMVYKQTNHHKIGTKIRCFHLFFPAAADMLVLRKQEKKQKEKRRNKKAEDTILLWKGGGGLDGFGCNSPRKKTAFLPAPGQEA